MTPRELAYETALTASERTTLSNAIAAARRERFQLEGDEDEISPVGLTIVFDA